MGTSYYEKIAEVEHFWGDRMPMMAMEEAGEFIRALSRMERKKTPKAKQNLKEKIRDMYISLAVIQLRYSIEDEEIVQLIDKKLNVGKES